MIRLAQPVTQPVVTSSTQSAALTFEMLLPALTIRFRKAAMSLPSWHDRKDALDEMIAISFTYYRSLVDRGKAETIYPTPLGEYAVKSYFSGRRFMGMSSVDVFAARCQLRGRSTVSNEICDYVCKKTDDPAVLGAFRVDFKDWWKTLDARTQSILHEILIGSKTNEISAKFSLSAGRISQLRRELIASWQEFVGDHCDEEEEEVEA